MWVENGGVACFSFWAMVVIRMSAPLGEDSVFPSLFWFTWMGSRPVNSDERVGLQYL
jgi:hypothetical protein